MSDRATELGAALEAATDAPAILEALARAVWYNTHDGAECPDDPDHLPSPEALAVWVAGSVAEEARTEAAELLTALMPPDWRDAGAEAVSTITTTELLDNGAEGPPRVARVPDRVDMAATWRYLLVVGLTAHSMGTDDPELYAALVEQAHQLWCTAGGRHPLAPLVDAWLQRPPPAEWDSRKHPVLSGTLAGRDGGLRPLVVTNDPRQLPLSLTGGSEPRQLWLGFEQPEHDVPVLPLAAFDRHGGVSMTSGAGAAHAIRLYVEALLAVPPDRRNDGSAIPLRAKLRDVVAGLWPRGWQRGRDWPRLLAGLDELRRLGVEWEHGGTGGVWFAVTVRSVPRESAPLDDLMQFEVQLPPGSGPGPMVAREHLRLLGLDSAPAYRLYLSLCWLWDHYGTVRGRLIGSDPPQRRGQPVEPVKVGDHLVNPAALHHYPALTPDHLAIMSYAPADLAQEGSSTRRTQRHRAREALDRITAQTGAVVVPSPGAARGSVQVLPPASHKAAHDGKAELWRHLDRDG